MTKDLGKSNGEKGATTAPITNVRRFNTLLGQVINRKEGLPGLGVFHGPSGDGKSWASIFGANKHRAYYVQCKSVWTRKTLSQAIVKEMGLPGGFTVASMVEQIGEELARSQRPLILDEADFLVGQSMIELVRDIYETSHSAVILIGEEQFPNKLKRWERVHGRVIAWMQTLPATAEDARLLAGAYCPGIEVEKALLDAIVKASAGSVRRVCVNLSRVEDEAQKAAKHKFTLADWDDREFYTGNPPARRHSAGGEA